jgi:antitoxin (DNA-binding transcriptional repressor) of toxin-antitoxin stability system
MHMESISISAFKATCLARLEKVRRTRQPLRITKRGEVIAEVVPPSTRREPGWLGAAAGTGRILGDLVEPVTAPDEWDVLKPTP